MNSTPDSHRSAAPRSVACHLVVASDSRTPKTDLSGALMQTLLEEHGHRVVGRAIVPDDPEQIRAIFRTVVEDGRADVLIVSGGTGLGRRDCTYEAITGLLEKKLDGFGELFRMLSYEDIGPAAMLSRATAGIARGLVVISLPGSPNAVRLALEKLLLPELTHLVAVARS